MRTISPFLRRKQALLDASIATQTSSKLKRFDAWSLRAAQAATVLAVILAIFGYFYTVRPVYQKERLSEQVAEYAAIIKRQGPKIAEAEAQLSALNKERSVLAEERANLTAELKRLDRQLLDARKEKARIEDQTRFMTFRYRLPDGRPAVTNEQVAQAQEFSHKENFESMVSFGCAGLSGDKRFSDFGSYQIEPEKEPNYPFTASELNMWREHGAKIPLIKVLQCIETTADRYRKDEAKAIAPALIERFRSEVVQKVQAEARKPWVPPLDPNAVIKDYKDALAKAETAREKALKKNQEEYGGWESVWGADRREIFKHNFNVGKANAEMQHYSAQSNAKWGARSQADVLRKSVDTEIKRLVTIPRKRQ